MDYFTLFGLPVDYSLDASLLTHRWQALQQQFHPDRYVLQPERQRLMALQQAATINDAYQTLKHPLKRAQYLLFLQGIDIDNEQQSMRDTVFLMEQLALREELDAIAQAQTPDTKKALTNFTARVAKMMQEYSIHMSQHFSCQNWLQMADTLRKLHFFDRLRQQIEELEEQWSDDVV